MNALRNYRVPRAIYSQKFSTAAAAAVQAPVARPRRRLELTAPLKITDAAAVRVKELLKRKPDAIGVRLGVKTRGCNGLSYTLNYAFKREGGDEEVNEKDVKVFIEPKALFHIVGTTMDFETTKVASEFTFHNPNAKGTCGCGESFNVG